MTVSCGNELLLNANDTNFMNGLHNREIFPASGHVVLRILFVSIYCVNVVGNASVWFTIPFQKQLQSPMNYLLLNLSLAHIISGVNVLLFCFVTDTGGIAASQSSRDVACAFTEGLCVYFIGAGAYLLTLCAISFNRYMAIQYPTRQGLRMQKNAVVIYNIVVWFICTGWVLPSSISFRYEDRIRICLRDWKHIDHPFVYRITALLWSIVIPLTFLFLSFSAIVWKRKEKNLLLDRKSMFVRKLHLQRAEKLLGLLIMTFLLTWLPFFIYWGLYTTGHFAGCAGEIDALKWLHVTVFFSTFNGALDPLLYTSGNKELKGAVLGFCKKLLCQTGNKVAHDSTLRSNVTTAGRISSMAVLPDVHHTLKYPSKPELFLVKKI